LGNGVRPDVTIVVFLHAQDSPRPQHSASPRSRLFGSLMAVSTIVLLNKPYGVLCQFTAQAGRSTLKDYVPLPDIYPAGRLDADSEGLVVLTADGAVQHRVSHPTHQQSKIYFVQVEGEPSDAALQQLRQGVALADFKTSKAEVERVEPPLWLWPRTPAVRFRRLIPTSWLRIAIAEGKNRQIRRMTAAVGFPTLRLIRFGIGAWTIEGLEPGQWREIEVPSSNRGRRARRLSAAVGGRRQPIARPNVKLRATPHPVKRKK
jgi:23S rRNA pseudouridine2457 synthase